MGKCKVKKPIVASTKPVKSLKHARRVVSIHHKLTAKLHAEKDKEGLADELRKQLDENGGIVAYQEASALSTNAHSTSNVFQGECLYVPHTLKLRLCGREIARWVLKKLRSLGFITHPPNAKQPAPRVLEIGAINTQLLDSKSVDVRAIDIHSLHPGRIEELDFMDLEQPKNPYDVLVLSMVLNCVPDATGRGAMLRKLRQTMRPGGLLFFVLPLTCLQLHAQRKETMACIQQAVYSASLYSFCTVRRATKETRLTLILCMMRLYVSQHSHNVNETAILEALAAVGLRTVKLEDDENPRHSPKLWFAILEAVDPDQDALQRFRRLRKHSKGKRKMKSIGGAFDVIL
eukprot:1179555-Prorocentrum_minimum.AAC.3